IIYSIKVYFGSFNVNRDVLNKNYGFNILSGVVKEKGREGLNYISLANFRHEIVGRYTSAIAFDSNTFIRDDNQEQYGAEGNYPYSFNYTKGIQGQGPITIWVAKGGELNVNEITNEPLVDYYIEYDIRPVSFPYDWDNLSYERS
ncbi:hypothetical protein LCGC14_2031770, partial [marine sediment metagenome]